MDTSITAHKTSFLTSQIRLLSTPLQPSPYITTQLTTSTSDNDDQRNSKPLLTRKQLDETITSVNDKLKSHTRLTFSSQATRHVAEQIHNLYWNDVSVHSLSVRDEEDDAVVVARDVDLTDSRVVEGLPKNLREAMLNNTRSGDGGRGDKERKFEELRARLEELRRERDDKARKLERYRRLQELMGLFDKPMENVQPNLVTRDGEMADELARLRVLCARVGARMCERDVLSNDENSGRDRVGFEEKLGRILDAT